MFSYVIEVRAVLQMSLSLEFHTRLLHCRTAVNAYYLSSVDTIGSALQIITNMLLHKQYHLGHREGSSHSRSRLLRRLEIMR